MYLNLKEYCMEKDKQPLLNFFSLQEWDHEESILLLLNKSMLYEGSFILDLSVFPHESQALPFPSYTGG